MATLDGYSPSMKMAVFVDGNGNERMAARKTAVFLAEVSKISSLARNRAVFMDDGPGYLLYLRDLDFSTPCGRSK